MTSLTFYATGKLLLSTGCRVSGSIRELDGSLFRSNGSVQEVPHGEPLALELCGVCVCVCVCVCACVCVRVCVRVCVCV